MKNRTYFGVAILAVAAGCGRQEPTEPYVNAEIATAYQEFYDKSATDRSGALAALDRADKLDASNGYGHILRAAIAANSSDYQSALESMRDGLNMKRVVIYVSASPPADPMPTLSRVRQLGYATDKWQKMGKIRDEFLVQARLTGLAVASSEPFSELSVAAGLSIVRRSFENQIKALESDHDVARLKPLKARFQEWIKWSASYTAEAKTRDYVREAGREAGLSDAELEDYALRKPLKDESKQKKADAARTRMYEEDMRKLRKIVDAAPRVD